MPRTSKGWNLSFEDPIPVDGGELVTLRQAADHIMGLPRKQRDLPHWQLAGQILIAAAEGRDFVMHARIAVAKAVNHGQPRPPRERRRARKVRLIS